MKSSAETSTDEVRSALLMNQKNRIAAAIASGVFNQLPISPAEVHRVIDPNFVYGYASLTRRILYDGMTNDTDKREVYTSAQETAQRAVETLHYTANRDLYDHLDSRQRNTNVNVITVDFSVALQPGMTVKAA